MYETSKMQQRRIERGDFEHYLHGQGIDIGCGDDPLVLPTGTEGHVQRWDLPQGDATCLASIPDATLDFVYSSHCLEHLADLPLALRNWVRVLKPGGWLYIVVPDYTLYEHHEWPSRYNGDHKQTFSLTIDREQVGRESHWGFRQILTLFKDAGAQLAVSHLEDYGYHYGLGWMHDQTLGNAVAQVCYIVHKPEEP